MASDLDWPEPTREARPGCYWWWPGSAVDKENLTWNLETLNKAGIGGVTVVPIYGVKGQEARFIPYLTPQWLDMLDHTVKIADSLNMWVDMTTGTGWPFGGPDVPEEDTLSVPKYKDQKVTVLPGRKVKRAAPGGEGYALCPFSPKAMNNYVRQFSQAFAESGVKLPRAQYHDSFEYKGNWSVDFLDQFKRLRGYDLTEHLPVLFGRPHDDKAARIKADYHETLSDLHYEYIKVWAAWAKTTGCKTRNQAHGAPGNLLDLYALADIPETEIFGSTLFKIPGIRREPGNYIENEIVEPLINRMPSSAAHVTGKPLTASETCTWIRNHFRAALSQVKPEIDQLFLCGINHIFFHGCCYSPKDAEWPGWLFYASLEANPRNAFWRDIPALNKYITRCQSILQSGAPDNDILVYWPIYDEWHESTGSRVCFRIHRPAWMTESVYGKTARWLIDHGYAFDFISDRQLRNKDLSSYKAIVIPKTTRMPLKTLQKIFDLSQSGVNVMFIESLPTDVPGFKDYQKRQADLSIMTRIRGGLVVKDLDTLSKKLGAAGVTREPMTDSGLSFIRRTHQRGHHYFVANMNDKAFDNWITLGAKAQSAIIMDPQSGRTGVVSARKKDGDLEIYLQLKPGETRIVRTFTDKQVTGTPWPVLKPAGDAAAIKGTWEVVFIDGGPRLPESFETKKLKSWTTLGDEDAKRFAGTARYHIEFKLPETDADEWMLDLGDVRESARVIVNGKQAGTLYSIPYQMPVGKFLEEGKNTLELEVTNLSANRIRDLDIRGVEWKIFYNINFVNHNYKKFDASKWPLTDSGLLGPVTLVPMERVEL